MGLPHISRQAKRNELLKLPPPPPGWPLHCRSFADGAHYNMESFLTQTRRHLEDVQPLFGRWYGRDGDFQRDNYIFPIDEEENDRLDLFHKFFLVARDYALFSSPLDLKRPLRILDLGTGTGIWPIDVSRALPHALVLGVDINRIQPQMIPWSMPPPRAMDIEAEWESLEQDWDLIHARTLFGSIRCWDNVYRKIYKHLKPATGYLEQVEIDWLPRYDTETPTCSALSRWTSRLLLAMDKHGCQIRALPEQTNRQLALAGFTDINLLRIKLCYSQWSNDPSQRMVASWFNVAFCRALPALSYRPMITYLEMSKAEVDGLCADVAREINSRQHRAYCELHIWTARRPV